MQQGSHLPPLAAHAARNHFKAKLQSPMKLAELLVRDLQDRCLDTREQKLIQQKCELQASSSAGRLGV